MSAKANKRNNSAVSKDAEDAPPAAKRQKSTETPSKGAAKEPTPKKGAKATPAKATTTPAKGKATPSKVAPSPAAKEDPEGFNKLVGCQTEINDLNDKLNDEVIELEKKYNKLRKPLNDKRTAAIKSIPEFWVECFAKHDQLSNLLQDVDIEILKHLTTLDVIDHADVKSGYAIEFTFSENPFFSDKKLRKDFTFGKEEAETKVDTSEIHWKNAKTTDENPESFWVQWFKQDDEMAIIGDIIHDELWKNPVEAYEAVPAGEEDELAEEGAGPDGDD
jgi:template-activating factor I